MRQLPSHSYGASPAITQCYLHATRHRWTRTALTPTPRRVLDLPIPLRDGRLSWPTRQCTGREPNSRSLDCKSDALTTRLHTDTVSDPTTCVARPFHSVTSRLLKKFLRTSNAIFIRCVCTGGLECYSENRPDEEDCCNRYFPFLLTACMSQSDLLSVK